jgi:AcrR family transcriptional regulator
MNEFINSVKGDPSGGRVARRRTRTRAQILEAAERAFAHDGFRNARIEQIAHDADVSVGSIYNHFANKDELYLALAEQTVAGIGAYMTAAFAASDSPLEQVMAAGGAYLRFHLDHPALVRYLSFDPHETADSTIEDAVQQRLSGHITALLDAFENRIQAAIEAGHVRPLDPRLAARFLFGAWNGVAALGLRHDNLALTPDEIEACLQQARRIVLDGLTDPSHRTPFGDSRARLLDTNT